MPDKAFDVWLHAMSRVTHEPAEHALSRAFGMPVGVAQALLSSLPRVVKRSASEQQAQQIVDTLQSIGGRAEAVAVPSQAASMRSAETLKLGTQDLPGMRTSSYQTAPAHVAPPPQEARLQSPPIEPAFVVAPLAPTWQAEPDAQGPDATAYTADDVPIVRHVADHAWQDPLALPLSQPPPSLALRSPRARARDPKRRAPPSRVASPALEVRSLLDPAKVALEIVAQAERSSWQSALRGHPVAGFLIVLTGTTSVFLLLYAMM